MKIVIAQEIDSTIIINTILYFLYNRSKEFSLDKEKIITMANYLLKYSGRVSLLKEHLKYQQEKDFISKKQYAESVARTYFHQLFPNESQGINYILSL
jgi:hypothetical protein